MQLTLADAGLERTDLLLRDQVTSLQQSKLEVDTALALFCALVQGTEEYAMQGRASLPAYSDTV